MATYRSPYRRVSWLERRFTSDDEEDVRWYFNDAESKLGLRSTLGGQLDVLQVGVVSDHVGSRDIRLPSRGVSERFARISRVFAEMVRRQDGPKHERVLFASVAPVQTLVGFDGQAAYLVKSAQVGGVLRHVPEVRETAKALGSLERALTDIVKAGKLPATIKAAKALLVAAKAAYVEARREVALR